MPTRYAIYFVPDAETALWHFGSEVLGYDAHSGLEARQWHPKNVSGEAWEAMTADPRLYGFHATLKAPFRLLEGHDETALASALRDFAASRSAVLLGRWTIHPVTSSQPGRAFVALTPVTPPPELTALEAAVVEHFDIWRAPLTADEIARRNPDRLTSRQRFYLDTLGYPYVLDEFRFHMTLTGAIENAAEVADRLAARAIELDVSPTVTVDRLALVRQDERERFRVVSVAALTAPELDEEVRRV